MLSQLPRSRFPNRDHFHLRAEFAENLDPPFVIEFKVSEKAVVARITGYVLITLPSNCSNAGYPCRGSRSGFIFSQM
jgi:hypothetical protein